MAVSDRTFGVEIECTYGEKPAGKSDVYERINMGSRYPQKQRAEKEIRAHPDFKRWADNIGIDGSGIEIRSPILKGQKGIEELAAFFDFLIERGSSVTNQDGMHVHYGAKDFCTNWKALYYTCETWGTWTSIIHKMVASRRRNGNMCRDAFNNEKLLSQMRELCLADPEVVQKESKEYEKLLNRWYQEQRAGRYGNGPPKAKYPYMAPNQFGGRGALNLANLSSSPGYKNTIEIRLAEGMMDTSCAVAWVKFGQAFLDHHATTEASLPGRKTLNNLLDSIGLDDDAKAVLKAKADNNGNALVNAAPGKRADGINFDAED